MSLTTSVVAALLRVGPRVTLVTDPGSSVDAATQERVLAAARVGVERADAAPSVSAQACGDAVCLEGMLVGADAVMRVRIDAQGRDYAYRLELHRAGEDPLLAEDTCEVCGLEEVAGLVEDQAATLLERYSRANAPGIVELTTAPPGAEVMREGVSLGTTPLRAELPPGRYTLDVQLPGYEPQRRSVSVGPGETVVIDTAMVVLSPPAKPWKPLAIAGGVGIGAGVVAVAVGAAMIAIDERDVTCSEDEANDFGVCPRRYSTLEGGAVSVGIGGAALVTGIVLEVIAMRRRSKMKRLSRVGLGHWRF